MKGEFTVFGFRPRQDRPPPSPPPTASSGCRPDRALWACRSCSRPDISSHEARPDEDAGVAGSSYGTEARRILV